MAKKRKIYLWGIVFFIVILSLILTIRLQSNHEEPQKLENKDTVIKTDEKNHKISTLQKLYNNNDIIALLNIPSIDFEEIIVKGKDNSYYLNHDLDKKEVKKGAAFIDYRTPSLEKAQQINIYGHNSTDSSLPFAQLEKYQEEDFFQSNQTIILKTEDKTFKYKVFAVSNVPKDSEEHMIIAYENEDFLNHVNLMRSNALLDTNETIKKDDFILVIQTCLFKPERFLLIFAKRV